MKITIKEFDQISAEELYEILALRSEIFVVEQDCVYQDIDNLDQKAIHVIGRLDNRLTAYARCFLPGDYFDYAAIGRIAVDKASRGSGNGHLIVKASIDEIYNRLGKVTIKISAQTYLEDFYRTHGFEPRGEPYLEDGIPHIAMIKQGC